MPISSSPHRTQAERSLASRQKILQEATRLFGENGYRGTRLADIAAAVQMTEPGILHHFGCKENLLLAVLEQRDRLDQERYTASGPENLDLLASLQDLVTHNETVPGLVQLFTMLVAESLPADQPGHEFFIQRYRSFRAAAAKVLKQAQDAGQVRKDIPAEDLAALVFAMMDGLQVQWLLEPQSFRMSQLFDRFIELLKR